MTVADGDTADGTIAANRATYSVMTSDLGLGTIAGDTSVTVNGFMAYVEDATFSNVVGEDVFIL